MVACASAEADGQVERLVEATEKLLAD